MSLKRRVERMEGQVTPASSNPPKVIIIGGYSETDEFEGLCYAILMAGPCAGEQAHQRECESYQEFSDRLTRIVEGIEPANEETQNQRGAQTPEYTKRKEND